MPTILRLGPYRFYFYSSDAGEPAHVHVERESNVAKFWVDPVRLAVSGGFGRTELNEIERMVTSRRAEILESWNDFFRG